MDAVAGGSKARSNSLTRTSKPLLKVGRSAREMSEEKRSQAPSPPALLGSLSAPSTLLRRELLLRSGLSMDASCSSDASTDSFCSRASTGRIGQPTFAARRKKGSLQSERVGVKPDRNGLESGSADPTPYIGQKKRCSWVTSSTDRCYAAFHDEEWGVPVHDDKKLFELLVLSGALAELTWPVILSKRPIFREVFMDFNPTLVSKLNEKKLVTPGSFAITLLSEVKLRAIIENARQIVKVVEEFGSFDRYCWSFVNYKPILSQFRYPRQVPVKTSKADTISKDLVRRGFRSVGPTVVYTFMQASGMTNDHLITCFRFVECVVASDENPGNNGSELAINKDTLSDGRIDCCTIADNDSDIKLSRTIDELSIM